MRLVFVSSPIIFEGQLQRYFTKPYDPANAKFLTSSLLFLLLISCVPSAHDPLKKKKEMSFLKKTSGTIDYYKRTSSDIETGEIPIINFSTMTLAVSE
jgi:hypothetical protein